MNYFCEDYLHVDIVFFIDGIYNNNNNNNNNNNTRKILKAKVIKHFPVFGSVMKNELENNLLIFYFFKFIKIIRNKSYKLKS
jgi:hypothetical protein